MIYAEDSGATENVIELLEMLKGAMRRYED